MAEDPKRLDRIEAALERLVDNDRRLCQRQEATVQNLDRLAGVVDSLTEDLMEQTAFLSDLGRQWQAYFMTIHPTQ